jgi:hypothetical protein
MLVAAGDHICLQGHAHNLRVNLCQSHSNGAMLLLIELAPEESSILLC